MRQARLTWQGAFHHIMNRGINGEYVFKSDELKNLFLNLLKEKIKKFKIRNLAYCIMDNHYHLILENNTGQMSEFMKTVNGTYGLKYRKYTGGKGYVFQSRFKSTLIENDYYLIQAVAYILGNPVKAKLVKTVQDYPWTSIREYFKGKPSEYVDNGFIEGLIGTETELHKLVNIYISKKLPVQHTEFGGILGHMYFYNKAINRFDRRKKQEFVNRKRKEDLHFYPQEQVIKEFEDKHKIKIGSINTQTYRGKKLRAELLIKLRDYSNMKYRDISLLEPFSDVQFGSLRSIYKRAQIQSKQVQRFNPPSPGQNA